MLYLPVLCRIIAEGSGGLTQKSSGGCSSMRILLHVITAPFTVSPQLSACSGAMLILGNNCILQTDQELHCIGHQCRQQGNPAGEDQDCQQLSKEAGGIIHPLMGFQRFIHKSLFTKYPAVCRSVRFVKRLIRDDLVSLLIPLYRI